MYEHNKDILVILQKIMVMRLCVDHHVASKVLLESGDYNVLMKGLAQDKSHGNLMVTFCKQDSSRAIVFR